jgi:hypothetical protein
MKPARTIGRRSFLVRVCGASVLALGGCTAGPIHERPYDPPAEPGRGIEREGCTDGDSGRYVDPPGHGRHCRFGEGRRRPRRH